MTNLVLLLLSALALAGVGRSSDRAQAQTQEARYMNFFGAYLGRPTPGTTPIRFASGILLASETRWWHEAPAFSPDGREMCTSFYDTGRTPPVAVECMRAEGGRWTFPHVVPFSNSDGDNGPRFSVGGEKLFFTSRRAGGALFVVNSTDGGWSSAQAVPIQGTTSPDFVGISLTRDGTVYFGDTEGGHLDIFRSSPEGGQYGIAENLGSTVNDPDSEDWGPYIDPDEDFLLFSSNRPGGFGMHDIYVCFRNPDGSWTQPQNLGEGVNSPAEDFAPLVTPDGKYLFFVSQKAGDVKMNAYWVSALIIEDFRSGG